METKTCWSLIESAARGSDAARERFARHYAPVVATYLGARWRGALGDADVDDALQEVFLECLKDGGVLERAESGRRGGFRAFLHGVTQRVAMRVEERRVRRREDQPETGWMPHRPEDDAEPDRMFDRAFALSTVRQAVALMEEQAKERGGESVQRVALLRERFADGKKIVDIARAWEADAAHLHKVYARARQDFEAALRDVVSFHFPGEPEVVESECRALANLMS